MTITITPEEVNEFCGCGLSDTMAQLYIDSVTGKIGECLELNYDDATAKLIALNLICHLSCGTKGQKTSVKAPNGASVNYQAAASKEGLQSSPFGNAAYMLDTSACWTGMIAQSFLFTTIGN